MADLNKSKELLKDLNIEVTEELEDNQAIKVEFKHDKAHIVMQVTNPLQIADIQGVYYDFIASRISRGDIFKSVDALDIVVNDKKLLDNMLNGKGKFEGCSLRERTELIDVVINTFVYFARFCIDGTTEDKE